MYLKRLDLQGFKSFPEKVKLEFNTGITAVVGPNGSGKSNISDAVRWVLGEQRAKSLRGDKMEDIIFAGTQNRKPLGFAEVSITIDNVDKKMPIDYTEVTVTRRVFRSGESEYQINGTACRLKDIHELFMDTGVGREGYSIIGQGRIEEILSNKPDERRKLFEEAAGIMKYKIRKNEAIMKLDRQSQNLVRVEDIINELSVQLDPLEKQSDAAKQYLLWKEKIKKAEISLFCTDADKIEAEIEKSLNDKEIVLENDEKLQKEMDEWKTENKKFYEEAKGYTEKIQIINSEIISLKTELEKKEGEILLAKEQAQHFTQNKNRISADIELKSKNKKENEEEIELLNTKLTAFDINSKMETQKLEKQEEEFMNLTVGLSKGESQMEEYKSDIMEQIKISTQEKGNISKREAMIDQFTNRRNQIDAEVAYLKSQIHDLNTHILMIDKTTDENITNKQSVLEAIKSESLLLEEKTKEKEILSRELLECTYQINKKKSRLSVLLEMEREQEGFFKSVKSVIRQKQIGNTEFSGICGAVGQLIEVPKEYETAVEIALGGAVQNIVTRTEQDAKFAINYLKTNQLGRATFLPISVIKEKNMTQRNSLLSEQGVVGIACELVKTKSEYNAVVSSILGKTLIMKDLDSSLALSKKYNNQIKMVTLDGELLNIGGSMTGGSTSKKNGTIFGRSREIRELEEDVLTAKDNEQNIQKAFKKQEELIFNFNNSSMDKRMELQKTELLLTSLSEDFEKSNKLLQEHKEKLERYNLEEKQIHEQLLKAEKDKNISLKIVDEAEKITDDANEKIFLFQNDLKYEKSRKDELLQQMTDCKISISNANQSKELLMQDINRIQRENKNLEENKENLKKELRDTENGYIEKIKKTENLKEFTFLLIDEETKKQNMLLLLYEKQNQNTKQITQIGKITEEKQSSISILKNELYRIDAKIEKLTEEKARIFNSMWEEYEMTYQVAKGMSDGTLSISELRKNVKEYKEAVRALGNVNVSAIEQYKDVKERFDFLTTQREDIWDAKDQLGLIITELSKQMEAQFREQVGIISKNFNEVFSEMFGGGTAYLKLTDETNILESSIEIIAQPPGKSLQNMLLLSGGERALTAIAILFAILKMKPSPFCILDEIEAALDDANVKRYANYLMKFSDETQFIVITHRKGTMESADVMYGITMQEKGVSKLISVSFSDEFGA